MPTAIYDSSYLTFRKRAGVLSAYKAALSAGAIVDYNIVRKEQPTFQSAEIIITRRQGACICAEDASGVSFNRSSCGPCSGGA
jgi:hypothetical protein